MLADLYSNIGPVGFIMLGLVVAIVIFGFKNGGGKDGKGNGKGGSTTSGTGTGV